MNQSKIDKLRALLQASEATKSPKKELSYNKEQLAFIDLVASGKSCVLTGAAGTGKTTAVKAAITKLMQKGMIAPITEFHKYLKEGTPGVACIAYTRRAVNNVRKMVSDDLKANCVTIHKFLEYEPVKKDVEDSETGELRTIQVFEPRRHKDNPIPRQVSLIVLDEASMVSVDLFKLVNDAVSGKVQIVFIGDIEQLPPVFGAAILGFAMLHLPVIQLTEVHRQALDSPIITLAHRILSGKEIENTNEFEKPDTLKIVQFKNKTSPEIGFIGISKFFDTALNSGLYNPNDDIILIPFNKGLGTDALNVHIANTIAKKENKLVYNVIAGRESKYFSVGDKVLVEKEDAIITKIEKNPSYLGKMPKKESVTMDYLGNDRGIASSSFEDEFNLEAALESYSIKTDDEDDSKRAASHVITVMNIEGKEFEVSSSKTIREMALGYAITVHKSQGSEWRKVFCVFHNSHNTMMQRELLYTAVTRAKEELFIFCEAETFKKGITAQKVKGNSLKEKAEFFKGKLEEGYCDADMLLERFL